MLRERETVVTGDAVRAALAAATKGRTLTTPSADAQCVTDRASAFDRWLPRSMMAALPGAGYEVVLWDGTRAGEDTGLRAHIRDRAALWQASGSPPAGPLACAAVSH